jgi:integrase
LREVIVFALESAARCKEIRNLVWADFCQAEATVTIRGTKAHRDRIVPLGPAALAIVEARLAARGLPTAPADPHIFTDPETKVSWRQFSNLPAWRKALADAGLTCTFHDLRRSCITTWIRQGYPLEAVRRLAGHARIEQTAEYCKMDIGDLRAVVEGVRYQNSTQSPPPTTPQVVSG